MTSPVIPAPADLFATPPTPASGLPVARAPEVVDRSVALAISLVGGGADERARDDRDGHGAPQELRVAGEIDLLTVAQLRAALDQVLTGTRHAVVVDLRGVTFVDCAGIGVLVEARWRARCGGVRLQIRPGQVVARTAALLDLTATLGLDERP